MRKTAKDSEVQATKAQTVQQNKDDVVNLLDSKKDNCLSFGSLLNEHAKISFHVPSPLDKPP